MKEATKRKSASLHHRVTTAAFFFVLIELTMLRALIMTYTSELKLSIKYNNKEKNQPHKYITQYALLTYKTTTKFSIFFFVTVKPYMYVMKDSLGIRIPDHIVVLPLIIAPWMCILYSWNNKKVCVVCRIYICVLNLWPDAWLTASIPEKKRMYFIFFEIHILILFLFLIPNTQWVIQITVHN